MTERPPTTLLTREPGSLNRPAGRNAALQSRQFGTGTSGPVAWSRAARKSENAAPPDNSRNRHRASRSRALRTSGISAALPSDKARRFPAALVCWGIGRLLCRGWTAPGKTGAQGRGYSPRRGAGDCAPSDGGNIGCGGGCSGDSVASWICFSTTNNSSRRNVFCPLVKRNTVWVPGGASAVARDTISNCSVMMPTGVPSGAVNTSSARRQTTSTAALRLFHAMPINAGRTVIVRPELRPKSVR